MAGESKQYRFPVHISGGREARHKRRRAAMKKWWKTHLAVGCAASALAIPAQAQDVPQPTEPSQQSAAAEPQPEEIIVTARRQNERLIDVPASISVLSAETLARTGITKAESFVQLTPGVTIVTGTAEAGDTQINIRGINGARDAESSVALVVDGILKTNTAQLNELQGTLRQVEILKGPQGALYGRNAAAGAIVLTTVRPGKEFGGAVTGIVAENSTYEARGYVAGPLSESVGVVLSANYRKTDGFYHNFFLDCDCVDNQKNYGWMAALSLRSVQTRRSTSRLDTPSSKALRLLSIRRSTFPILLG
ncbi:TonB-dependent receptor [Sphingomonas sediminicola]|uniref:TonB-dependent receptor n=1 Tax=Sphingomonas sediminicola TaxID=386874 RepID=UPI0031B57758